MALDDLGRLLPDWTLAEREPAPAGQHLLQARRIEKGDVAFPKGTEVTIVVPVADAQWERIEDYVDLVRFCLNEGWALAWQRDTTEVTTEPLAQHAIQP